MTTKKYQLLGSTSGTNPFRHSPFRSNRHSHRQHQPSSDASPTIELSRPLGKGERGGIIGYAAEVTRSPTDTGPNGGFGFRPRQNDEGVIKVALLLVDRIDKPTNNYIGGPEDNSKDVTGLGLGTQSKYAFGGQPNYSQLTNFVWETYKSFDEREPGQWSLWQQHGNATIPPDQLSPALAFQLELTNGLIVPDANTPFEDVVLFKERHRDELISLRHHLEEFAIKLSKEGDPRAVNLERERFDVSLSEYLKKARQSNIKRAVASLTTELDWAAAVRSAVSGGGGGGLLATAQGLSLTQTAAAIGGGVLASLSIKSVAGLREGPSPFRYIARIEREYGG